MHNPIIKILNVCLVLKIALMSYRFLTCLNFSEHSSHVEYTQSPEVFLFARTTVAHGVNNRVNETSGIIVKLKITPEAKTKLNSVV
jgi:hypothetical protein